MNTLTFNIVIPSFICANNRLMTERINTTIAQLEDDGYTVLSHALALGDKGLLVSFLVHSTPLEGEQLDELS